MVTPDDYDLPAMIRGTNYQHGFVFADDGNGEPKSFEGCTVIVELSNVDGVFDTLTTTHCLYIGYADGAVVLIIDDSVIADYPLGECTYKLIVTEINGEINRYAEGRIMIRG